MQVLMDKLIYPWLYKPNLSVEDAGDKTLSLTTYIKIGIGTKILLDSFK